MELSSKKLKIVWFSEIKWDYLKTRKQHIIENFPKNWEILFIENFVLGKPNRFKPERFGNVTRLTIPFYKATQFGFINRLQGFRVVQIVMELFVRAWVHIACHLTGFSSPQRIIATSNVYFADVIKKMGRRLVYYDCNDYPMGFSTTLPFVESYFEKTCRLANVVTSVSTRLMQEVHRYRTNSTHVVGNGVDYELFANLVSAARPADMENIPKPILMFTGALTEWFNTELIEKIATAIPESNIVLVGPIKHRPVREALIRLHQSHKIFLLGEKLHSDLPKYIQCADVCILPGTISKRTLGANPNTLYEYLACGKPIVTRNFSEEINMLKDDVWVADTEEDFVFSIQVALKNPPDSKRLQAIAKKSDWKIKSSQIAGILSHKYAETQIQ